MQIKNKYGFSFIDKNHKEELAIIYATNREDAEKSFYDLYGNNLEILEL